MKNLFKYRCADCGWTGFFPLMAFARSNRPKCGNCGCSMLDPTNDDAAQRIELHRAEATAQHEISKAKTTS